MSEPGFDKTISKSVEEEAVSGQLLGPYRVLDLTEGGIQISGKILADLGADVIKVEPPDGSPTRNIGPFYKGDAQKEKSLFWFAYNANKRSVTLDLNNPDGQDIFRQLVKVADVVLESFAPGYMDSLGLGFTALSELNPKVIMTSITPFGQTGPKAAYKSCDLTSWASGGILYVTGDPDRPPCWVSFPQASLFAGAHAATASLLALFHRRTIGEGQQIDVSTQECVIRPTTSAALVWEFTGQEIIRAGNGWWVGASGHRAKVRMGYRCKDGFVAVNLFGGGNAGIVNATRKVVEWMDEEGVAPSWLKEFDWVHDYDASRMSHEVIDRVEEQWTKFFLTKTKMELFTEALKRGLLLASVNTARDIRESPQLQARGFWQEVEHPELGAPITYCGSFARINNTSPAIRRRPPLIGEHNEDVYENELGITKADHTTIEQRSNPETAMGEKSLPLQGIKVVDFTWMIAGPQMGAWLGSWGATVVRVESHTRLETTRFTAPYKDDRSGVDRSAYWANWNCCKYGVTFDLNKPKGRELALKLIQWADIVIESFSAGQMRKWGLEYDEAVKIRPDIIYLSTNQLGQTGPYAGFSGFGHHAAALSGITELTGWQDRDPAPPRGVYTDHIAPPFAEAVIVAALEHRTCTGEGTYIDLAQAETALQFIAPVVMDYAVNGHIGSRQGNRLSQAAPHGVYPCSGDDRWIAIGVFTDDEWRTLCDTMRKSELAEDPRFGTLQGRKEYEDELEQILAQWTSGHNVEELESLLQSAGIAAHGLNTCGELLRDPQLVHRGYFQKLAEHPIIGTQSYESPPYRLSKGTTNMFRAPCLGEHNDYVFTELLGLSDDEVADLLIERVITTDADMPSKYM